MKESYVDNIAPDGYAWTVVMRVAPSATIWKHFTSRYNAHLFLNLLPMFIEEHPEYKNVVSARVVLIEKSYSFN